MDQSKADTMADSAPHPSDAQGAYEAYSFTLEPGPYWRQGDGIAAVMFVVLLGTGRFPS